MQKTREGWVRSFSGNQCLCSSVIGICRMIKHQGYINKKLMKEHDCVYKKCPWFQKISPDYWEGRQRSADGKRELQKQAEDLYQQEIKERDAFIRETFSQYAHMYVTVIREEGNALAVYYIRDQYIDLSKEKRSLQKKYKRPVHLNAVITSSYVIDKLIRERNGVCDEERIG